MGQETKMQVWKFTSTSPVSFSGWFECHQQSKQIFNQIKQASSNQIMSSIMKGVSSNSSQCSQYCFHKHSQVTSPKHRLLYFAPKCILKEHTNAEHQLLLKKTQYVKKQTTHPIDNFEQGQKVRSNWGFVWSMSCLKLQQHDDPSRE